MRIVFKDRGGKLIFYVADKGWGFGDMGGKRAEKREHLLLYSLGIKQTGNRKIYILTESFIYTLFQ